MKGNFQKVPLRKLLGDLLVLLEYRLLLSYKSEDY